MLVSPVTNHSSFHTLATPHNAKPTLAGKLCCHIIRAKHQSWLAFVHPEYLNHSRQCSLRQTEEMMCIHPLQPKLHRKSTFETGVLCAVEATTVRILSRIPPAPVPTLALRTSSPRHLRHPPQSARFDEQDQAIRDQYLAFLLKPIWMP
jgi:hypothetical protein